MRQNATGRRLAGPTRLFHNAWRNIGGPPVTGRRAKITSLPPGATHDVPARRPVPAGFRARHDLSPLQTVLQSGADCAKVQRAHRERQRMARVWFKLRRAVARSWLLSRGYYRLRGARLIGRPADEVWYFAYGANMHDGTLRVRRGIQPLECRSGRIKDYRLRFNLEGRPRGKAAPANLRRETGAEVWGVAYRITRRDLMRLELDRRCSGRRLSSCRRRGREHRRAAARCRRLHRRGQGCRRQAVASLHHVAARRRAGPRAAGALHPFPRKRRARGLARSVPAAAAVRVGRVSIGISVRPVSSRCPRRG